MYDTGAYTWRSLREAFPKDISVSAARRTCNPSDRARLLKRARDGDPVSSTRTRRSKFEELDAALKTWSDGIETMGGADLPMTMAELETRAREIATELGVEGFLGSPGVHPTMGLRPPTRERQVVGPGGLGGRGCTSRGEADGRNTGRSGDL